MPLAQGVANFESIMKALKLTLRDEHCCYSRVGTSPSHAAATCQSDIGPTQGDTAEAEAAAGRVLQRAPWPERAGSSAGQGHGYCLKTDCGCRPAAQTSIMIWRQIFTFVQSAMLNILAHPWGVRIWAIAGALLTKPHTRCLHNDLMRLCRREC